MEILILVVVIGIAFWILLGMRNTALMNDDPLQNELFVLILNASITEQGLERADAISEIEDAVFGANLSSSQTTTRLAHACSMIKTTGNVAAYERSKHICDGIVRAWPEKYSLELRRQ